MGEWFGLALWLALAAGLPPGLALGGDADKLWPRPWDQGAVFHVGRRAVSNWRAQSTRSLEAPLLARLTMAYGDGADLPRCVRLNNYWCVKRAGWSGEIAADAEGHVAFASALEGGAVAALLLRRYYVDLKLTSGLDIVSRWAPAQCGAARAAGRGGAVPSLSLAARRRAGPARANTLRARWLARNRPGFTGARVVRVAGLRKSAVRDHAPAMLRAPVIAVGGGEGAGVSAARLSSLDLANFASFPRLPAPSPQPSCSGERARIDAYAARLAAGLAEKPTDDLKLFDAEGEPTPHLARALLNMTAVEIGPYRATNALAEEAVAELREILRLRREIAAGATQQAPASPDGARLAPPDKPPSHD